MWSKCFLFLLIIVLLLVPYFYVRDFPSSQIFFSLSEKVIKNFSFDERGDLKSSESKAQTQVTKDVELATITFVGDVLLARNVEYLIGLNGSDYPFRNIKSIFASSSMVVGNFESAVLKNHKKTPSFVTTFSVDEKLLSKLSDVGFRYVSLSNNHSLDYGQETFNYTVTALTSAGLGVMGHPQIVNASSSSIISSGDYMIGLLSLNEVFSNTAWSDVQTELNRLALITDYQIIYVHWGEEYFLVHNAAQETLAKKLIDAGADAIIGHHPHVVQDIQIYNNKPIFYSLGNFLFDQYFSVDVQQGLVVTLTLGSSTAAFELIPVSSEGTLSQPHKMDEVCSALFLKNLSRRSDDRYAEYIATNKLILPLSVATSS